MLPNRSRSLLGTAAVPLLLYLSLSATSRAQDLDTWIAPPVNEARIENATDRDRSGRAEPWRVGTSLEVDLSPANSGSWEPAPGGGQLWRLQVRSPGALWIVLGFGEFSLKAGATLEVHDPRRREVLGPFRGGDEKASGELWLPPVTGETVVLELRWPEELRGTVPGLRLTRVAHGFRDWRARRPADEADSALELLSPTGTGDSGWCNVDIACPAGDGWHDASRGVLQLLIAGIYSCTGSLIGNTAGDCRPYVLTANHCLSTAADAGATTFLFNYERTACDGTVVSAGQTMTGSALVATSPGSDFTLLELDEMPDAETNASFNGWNRSTLPAAESWTIHHPKADVKKISHDADPLVPGSEAEMWRVTEWETGTTELGSSGAPLFDPQHRIVGQLSRGVASCEYTSAYDEFGRFDSDWSGEGSPESRLSDWLDPWATGMTELDGLDLGDCLAPQPWLEYGGHTVDDTSLDGDGAAEPGETFLVPLIASNVGTAATADVSGSLSTGTPLVQIVAGQVSWDDLDAGQSALSLAPHFSVALAPGFLCGEPASLQIDWTSNEGAWSSAFEISTGTLSSQILFADDMEAGTEAWTVDDPLANNPWDLTTADSNSPIHSWFVADPVTVSDSRLIMGPLAVSARGRLGFSHSMDSENGFDGGVLEYSLDGTIWSDAGSLITVGGYTERISYYYGSPIAGRLAWSGNSGGWRGVSVDLSTLADNQVLFRWRFTSDKAMGDVGWFVDDVIVENVWHVCDGPAGCDFDTDCDDGVPCTEDVCDAGEAICSHLAPPRPQEVTGLMVDAAANDPSAVQLRWDAVAAADDYSVYVGERVDLADLVPTQTSVSGTSTTETTPFGSSGLLVYLIASRNCAGESTGCDFDTDCDDGVPCTEDVCDAGEAICSHLAPPRPQEVTGLMVDAAANDPSAVQLRWDAVAAADDYSVYVGERVDLADLVPTQTSVSGTSTTETTPFGSSGLLVYLIASRNCAGESGH